LTGMYRPWRMQIHLGQVLVKCKSPFRHSKCCALSRCTATCFGKPLQHVMCGSLQPTIACTCRTAAV
jgi:hypothetical protein